MKGAGPRVKSERHQGLFNKIPRLNRYAWIQTAGSGSNGSGWLSPRSNLCRPFEIGRFRGKGRMGGGAARRSSSSHGGAAPELAKTGAPGSNSTGSLRHGDVRGTRNTPRALSWRCREGRAVRCCRGGPTAAAPCWRRCPSYRGELQATENCQKGKGSRGKAHWGCSWPEMLRGEAGGEVRAGRRGGD